jgi:hypothetical protein
MHMDNSAPSMDSDTFREHLMAPNPMQRVMALHALEVESENEAGASQALAIAAARFVARGIPFYATEDPHYCAWVGRAVSYWERLHAKPSPSGTAA